MKNRLHDLLPTLWALAIGVAACDTVPRELQRDKGPDPAASGELAACVNCHGEGSSPAPPRSASGATSTADVGVGAHAAHLTDGPLRAAIACSECHAPVTDLTHMDGVARVAFGPLASAGGATPTWNRAGPAPSCATTYCHGATLAGGGTNVTPVWTKVDGSQASCGTCHGLPPPPPHPTSTACGACHTGYSATTVAAATHIDGIVQVASGPGGTLACGTCHSIPPPAPHTASTSCGTCHSGYTSTTVNASLHQNGTVDVLALSCTSCHGAPPATGQHTRSEHRRSCGDCHPGYTATSANAALHQNGVPDVGNRITSYDRSTRTCANSCHGGERW